MDMQVDQTRRTALGLGAMAMLATFAEGLGSAQAAETTATAFASPITPDGHGLELIRVFTGDDGHSHFEKSILPGVDPKQEFKSGSGALAKPGFLRFMSRPARSITILSGPADLDLPEHNAPTDKKEFFLMIQGSNMLITRTATQLITPGMIVIFEDATGTGHSGKVGPHGYAVVNVQLAD
jgi:hypothetical protein